MVDVEVRLTKFQYVVTTNHQWTSSEEYMNTLNEIRKWLTEHIGEPYNDWVTTLGRNDCLEVRFVRKIDATWFTLRWV